MDTPNPSSASNLLLPERRYYSRHVLLWVALALLFLLDYAWTFHDLVRGWIDRDRLVLGLVVLAGAAFLVWDRREELARAEARPSRWGLAFIAFSVLLLFVGTRAGLVFRGGMSAVFLRGVSLVAFLCGAVLFFGGWNVMQPLWLPAALLLFIYPENYFTAYWVPLRLQTVAAAITEIVVSLLGNVVVREGHVLETAGFSANVEEACSGIRSLMTVVPTAVFIGAYGLKRTGAKLALVLLSVPLTILANVLRVSMTVVLGIYVGRKAAEGFFHYFAGLGIFLLCLVGLLVLMKLLRLTEDSAEGVGQDNGTGGPPGVKGSREGHPVLWCSGRGFLAVAGILAVGVLYQGFEIYKADAAARKYPQAPLDAIPQMIGRWEGQNSEVRLDWIDVRHTSDWLYREYRAPGEPTILVLVLYWRPGAGTLIGRRGHTPESCFPYHGMKQEWTQIAEVPTGSPLIRKVSLRSSIFSGRDNSVVVTSWQQAGFEPTSASRLPKSRLGLAVYGAREILRIGTSYGPELAFQFITTLEAPAEQIVPVHRDFAASFIDKTLQVVWQ